MISLEEYLDYIGRYKIPPEPPNLNDPHDYLRRESAERDARDYCVQRGAWTIIADTWISQLARWIGECQVLEIMAGAGWLAHGLQQHGVNIRATDDYSWNARHSHMRHLTDILMMDAITAVNSYPRAEILLVSWPPYNDRTILEVCRQWNNRGPIIYIGEGEHGCNAPIEFFYHFRYDPNLYDDFYLPQWHGIHDQIWIGQYLLEKD